MKRSADDLRPWFLLLRDATAFIAGAALFGWESIGRPGEERPTFIVAYFALMGLPFVLRADQRRQD